MLLLLRRRRRLLSEAVTTLGEATQDGYCAIVLGEVGEIVVMEEMLDGIFETVNGGYSIGLPTWGMSGREENEVEGSLDVRCIVIDELLGKVMRDTVDAALETLVTRCLARLDKAFNLVFLTLGAYEY